MCMRVAKTPLCLLVAMCWWLTAASPLLAACGETGVQLQILGSAGPRGQGGRASAGYLVWIGGVSRIMIDAGGGTFVRFNESGARLADLQLLALSHFHPDHSSAVPALLWPPLRGATLRVAGPSGSGLFPSLDDWLDGLVGPSGVFRLLADRPELDAIIVDVTTGQSANILRDGDLRVTAIGVPHGDVPALGYRVDVGDASVVFSSDQNGSDPAFIEFAKDVDVLVVHLAVSEDPPAQFAELHARPSVWGRMAADAGVGHLVISHFLTSGSQTLEARLGHVRENYTGPLTVGQDLLCVNVE